MSKITPAELVRRRFDNSPQLLARLLTEVTGRPVSRSTVASWYNRGQIPAKVYGDVLKAAAQGGIPLTADELINGGEA